MMYASKIEIKREPQPVHTEKRFTIHGQLTLNKLSERISMDTKFSVIRQENGMYPDAHTIEYTEVRMETEAEVAKRVAKEEAYMKNYYIHHEKYKK